MSRNSRIVITGAAGFLGQQVVRALLALGRSPVDLVLVDAVSLAEVPGSWLVGDLRDERVLEEIVCCDPSAVLHLAGVLGGAAETDHELARSVNVDATTRLFERLRDAGTRPRVVFASSTAVFGPPLPDAVDDSTAPHPLMVYGAQKLQMEIVLEHFSARRWLDGISLRLPGVVARRGADARLKSAFLNHLFYLDASSEPLVMPMSRDATTWLVSAAQAAEGVVHAMTIDGETLGRQRSLLLPAQRVSLGELADAIERRRPGATRRLEFAPDEALEAQFGRFPTLDASRAERLRFRHDGSVDALLERATRD